MQKPYSYHIFLFPFRWDYYGLGDTNKTSFVERTSLSMFNKLLDDGKQWQTEEYKLNNPYNYNEFTYFYDFVRDAIFDTNAEKKDDKKVLNHYSYKLPKKSKYSIKLRSQKETQYELDIENIYLHVYASGVALLSFHLENNQTKECKDILNINEYGRRIYPQFLSGKQDFTNKIKEKFLADEIEIIGISDTKENFSEYDKDFNNFNKKTVFRLPKFIETLLGVNFDTTEQNNKIKISSLIDDRMFVISWYGNNEIIGKCKSHGESFSRDSGKMRTHVSDKYNYVENTDWYRYLFIDSKYPMCQNPEMQEELLRAHTYARFIDWGTLYGISRYSFVCLTSDLETLINNDADFIQTHIKTMYYQMVVLSLMQRASILRFAHEVTEISKLPENDIQQLKEIKALNKAYLKFTNKMYFREVTAQEQGIALYDMLQKHMRIERDVKDLNREIDELYQFARLLEDEKEREQMSMISKIGAVLLIPALIAGVFGMNTFREECIQTDIWRDISLVSTIVLPIIGTIVIIGLAWHKKSKPK